MKQILLFLTALMLSIGLCACTKIETVNPPEENTEEQGQPVVPVENPEDEDFATIIDLWQISMRQEFLYPFKVYVLQLNTGRWFYLRRLNYDGELRIGDEIAGRVYRNIPDEIAVIDAVKPHKGSIAKENAMRPATGSYLVASDPIEADVKNMFKLSMRYTLSFTPIETVIIETTDGNLIYVKASKLPETHSEDLSIGDHFVYNVYTIYPNEVVAIKKLR